MPWLVQQQLADQPPDQLNTGFPPGGANNVKVTVPPDPSDPSQPIVIEIPGASALDGASLDRLASQIGATLKQVLQVDRIQITDGGKPVRIPIARRDGLLRESVADRYQPVTPSNQLFFVHSGAVYRGVGPSDTGQGRVGRVRTDLGRRDASRLGRARSGRRARARDRTRPSTSPTRTWPARSSRRPCTASSRGRVGHPVGGRSGSATGRISSG